MGLRELCPLRVITANVSGVRIFRTFMVMSVEKL